MTERRADHPIRDLLSHFDARYQAHSGARYPFNGGKDSKLMKDLLVMYTQPEIAVFIDAFFQIDDPFIEQSGHSLGVFRGCLPKVIKFVHGQRPKADDYGHNPPCVSRSACIERVVREGREAREKARVAG